MFVWINRIPVKSDLDWTDSKSPGANLPYVRLINSAHIIAVDYHEDYGESPDLDLPNSWITLTNGERFASRNTPESFEGMDAGTD